MNLYGSSILKSNLSPLYNNDNSDNDNDDNDNDDHSK